MPTRHQWTDEEVGILCCLTIHAGLEPKRIGELMQINECKVSYKLSKVNGTIKGGNLARLRNYEGQWPEWRYWWSLDNYEVEVQEVLRRFQIECWPNQQIHDYLAVLKVHGGGLSNGEVARMMRRKFPVCTFTGADLQQQWAAVDPERGSVRWLKDGLQWRDDDPWVIEILQDCGLWIGFDRASRQQGVDLRV